MHTVSDHVLEKASLALTLLRLSQPSTTDAFAAIYTMALVGIYPMLLIGIYPMLLIGIYTIVVST